MSTRSLTWTLVSGLVLSASSTLWAAPPTDQNSAQNSAPAGEQTAERSGQAADDASLATDLRASLADRVPGAGGISVEASRGVVALSGTVGSEAAKRRAVSIAWQMAGVRRVDDQLQVRAAR